MNNNKMERLQGRPASPGQARGPALLFRGGKTPSLTSPTVIVATSLSVDFVVYSHLLIAIVTEEGGILSHGASVARELGVPCVVGVPLVSEVIEDGDTVSVDGTLGLVEYGHFA